MLCKRKAYSEHACSSVVLIYLLCQIEDKKQKKHFKTSFTGYTHSAVGYKRIFNNKNVASVQLR